MVKLRQLLGNHQEVYYECMYTKHKTQKSKTWHDGFVSLHASRRIVLYEEPPPEGKVLDDAKMNVFEWERKDDDQISVPKFLIEILNETPIQLNGKSSSNASAYGSSSAPSEPVEAPVRVAARPGGLSRGPSKPTIHTKFKSPLSNNSAPPTNHAAPYRPSHPVKRTASGMRKDAAAAAQADLFDFARNPTSEWNYQPNAISRTPDEVAALWFGDELFD